MKDFKDQSIRIQMVEYNNVNVKLTDRQVQKNQKTAVKNKTGTTL